MALVKKDLKGLRCPIPSLKINAMLANKELQAGDILEVVADCATFVDDVKKLCATWKKQVVKVLVEGEVKTITIKI